MFNFPIELSHNDTPVQRISTTLSDLDSNQVVFGNVKNRKSTALLYQNEEEEEKVVENNCSSLEELIQQLRTELQQTRALVSKLETRLELTEQTSQEIVGELKNLLSENESESHTTAVEIDQIDQESEKGDDMKIDIDDDEFYISSSLMSRSLQEETSNINNEHDTTSPSESSIIQHVDDTNDSYNRICSALQNLISDAQVALQKPNSSSSHQLLGLPQTTTRPRAQSWSSNVSSWIMNHYNPPPIICECGSCWLCLESSNNSLSSTTTTTRTTPKSSRANSISSMQRPTFSLSTQQESDDKKVNSAGIKRQYRKKLEKRFDYRKSCDDLEMEIQKLITTAISTGMEHGLMHSPVYRQYYDVERSGDSDKLHDYSYFRNRDDEELIDENKEKSFSRFSKSFSKCFEIFCKREQFKELESTILNDDNNNGYDNKQGSSKWRRRIWDCLQKMGVNFDKKYNDNSNKEELEELEEEYNENNGYSSYSSYGSYNSSWKSPSCDYRENSNDDSSNPFPSSFINTLNIGQNIFNFNVNLINSTTNNYNKTTNNYFNEIDNNTTPTTNTTINSHKEKSSFRQPVSKKLQSLVSKCTNLLAMIGLMISMSQTNKTITTVAPSLMNVAARNIIRNSVKRRRGGRDMVLMIKVIKYIAVLFVGWVAGRIGKKRKESSDENNRITEIPLTDRN